MTRRSSQASGGATRAIVNAFSSGGVLGTGLTASLANGARELLSGALTANTLKTLLTVSGPGQCGFLTAYAKDTTARTVRLVVIADGVTVFDATSASLAANGSGLVAVGSGAGSTVMPGPTIRWSVSLVIQVASSVSEADKVAIGYSLN